MYFLYKLGGNLFTNQRIDAVSTYLKSGVRSEWRSGLRLCKLLPKLVKKKHSLRCVVLLF